MSDSFRTTAGRCVVEDGTFRIEPRDGGALGTFRDALATAEIPVWRRVGVVLGALVVGFGVVAVSRFLPTGIAALLGVVTVAVLGRGWWRGRRRGSTDAEEIPLDAVVGVDARSGVPLLSRPRFVVRYHDEGGVKHRYLRCPSRLYGFGAYEKGVSLFRSRGLLAER